MIVNTTLMNKYTTSPFVNIPYMYVNPMFSLNKFLHSLYAVSCFHLLVFFALRTCKRALLITIGVKPTFTVFVNFPRWMVYNSHTKPPTLFYTVAAAMNASIIFPFVIHNTDLLMLFLYCKCRSTKSPIRLFLLLDELTCRDFLSIIYIVKLIFQGCSECFVVQLIRLLLFSNH